MKPLLKKKAITMPNNQDAVKLIPCQMCGHGTPYVPSHVTTLDELSAQIVRRHTRAPTPREQELEAQNKALWELVDFAEYLYKDCTLGLSRLSLKSAENLVSSLAAIQKAREAK
jgi:hypothetical protein